MQVEVNQRYGISQPEYAELDDKKLKTQGEKRKITLKNSKFKTIYRPKFNLDFIKILNYYFYIFCF